MTTTAVPRLTLGLPTYNGERFLAESLDALLAQAFIDCDGDDPVRGAEVRRSYVATMANALAQLKMSNQPAEVPDQVDAWYG